MLTTLKLKLDTANYHLQQMLKLYQDKYSSTSLQDTEQARELKASIDYQKGYTDALAQALVTLEPIPF